MTPPTTTTTGPWTGARPDPDPWPLAPSEPATEPDPAGDDLAAQIAAEVADAVAATMASRRRFAPRDSVPLCAAMTPPDTRRPNRPRPFTD